MKENIFLILLIFITNMIMGSVLANRQGKTIDRINFKNWVKGEKSIISDNGIKFTYIDRQSKIPECSAGITLPAGAYLKLDSPLLDGDFSDGLGITVKFKLFPRDQKKAVLRTLVSKYDYGTNNRCFYLMVDNNNRLEFAISEDGVKILAVTSPQKLEDNKVYEATAVFYPGEMIQLYLNGVPAGTKKIGSTHIYKGKCNLRIGARADRGIPAQLLNGIAYYIKFFIPAMQKTLSSDTLVAIPFSKHNKKWQSELKKAPALPGIFFKSEQEFYVKPKPALIQAVVRALYFSDGLGLLVHCPMPQIKKAVVSPKNNYVEFCVDPNNGDQTLFSVKTRIDGKSSSAFIASCDYVQKNWLSNAQTHVHLYSDSYDAMIKIPYEAFGMQLSPGDVIGLGISINRGENGKNILSSWPNRKNFWTWWQRRLIPDPFFFASVLLEPEENTELKFISATRGSLSANGSKVENSFIGEFINSSDENKTASLEAYIVKNGQKKLFFNRSVSMLPGSFCPVRFSYPGNAPELVITAKTNGDILYQTKLTKKLDLPQRMHDRGGSFMADLVETVKMPMAEQGFLIYPHQMKGYEGGNQSAKKFGYAYTLESAVADMGKNKEIAHMTVRTETDYNNLTAKAGILKKYGVKAAYYPHVKCIVMKRPGGLPAEPYMVNVSGNPNAKDPWGYKPLPCDAFKRDYFTALGQDLSRYGDIIYALILEDEFDYQFIKAMKKAFATPESQRRNPLIMKINDDIKKRFGDGRYGLFNSATPKEDEPYCKIAMHRWLNDWISKFIKEVVHRARSAKPGIKIIGDDPQGMVFPYDYRGRWHGVIDIAIHQTHDKGMPQDVGTAVVCKFVKDVSGIEEFWPCVHVEGSSSIFSLDESREELSRAFRNGATGLALFNLNWGGALGVREDIGAPERWEYVKQIAKFYGKGNRAKLPKKTDVGVFFSNITTMADNPRGLGYVYMYLGPATGGYFKFFDDLSLARGDVSASDYKIVFVHHAQYESPAAVKKLIEAVRKDGITLVVTDPQAFSKDCTGNTLPERSELLGRSKVIRQIGTQTITPQPIIKKNFSAMKTMMVEKAWSLSAGKNTDVLFAYADGSPACISRKLGKGRVIFFGFNPFFFVNTMRLDPNAPTGFDYGDKPIADPNLAQVNQASRQFFTMFLKYLNAPLGYEIWKLKLPAPVKKTRFPEDSCLSGNSIFWSLNRPRTIVNVPVAGKYRYSPFPEEREKTDKNGWIDICSGRLFDRIKAYRAWRRDKDCVLTWNSSNLVNIEIDLAYIAAISKIEVYVSGTYSSCEVYVKNSEEKWQLAGENNGSGKIKGVVRKSVDLKNIKTRYLKIKFKAGTPGDKFIISEIDVWGKL